MQLQQGRAWKQVTAPLRVRGIDVAEGLDHFRELGITELRLEFRLEPRMPGRCARIWRALRYLVGMPGAMQPHALSPGRDHQLDLLDRRDRHGRPYRGWCMGRHHR